MHALILYIDIKHVCTRSLFLLSQLLEILFRQDNDATLSEMQWNMSTVLGRIVTLLQSSGVTPGAVILVTNYTKANSTSIDPGQYFTMGVGSLQCISRVIPPAFPGVFFSNESLPNTDCSYGILNQIAQFAVVTPHIAPWFLSFFCGGMEVLNVLNTWQGSDSNITAAQSQLSEYLQNLSSAQTGALEQPQADGCGDADGDARAAKQKRAANAAVALIGAVTRKAPSRRRR